MIGGIIDFIMGFFGGNKTEEVKELDKAIFQTFLAVVEDCSGEAPSLFKENFLNFLISSSTTIY